MKTYEKPKFSELNILNLEYGQYPGSGKYDIPMMLPVHIDNLKDIPIQGFNFAISDKHRKGKGCHFWLHDYQFERVWNYPEKYIPILEEFEFVMSPDFSPYSDMPKVCQIYNVYRNRWCGRFWQEHGIKVIPTVTWSDDSSLEFCLDGIPKNSTIAISTMGEGRWAGWQSLKNNWKYVMDTLQPETVLLYGKDLTNELDGNIVHKKLISSSVAITEE